VRRSAGRDVSSGGDYGSDHGWRHGEGASVDNPAAWVQALAEPFDDDALAERLRVAARAWVEENFSAHDNAERLLALFEATILKGP